MCYRAPSVQPFHGASGKYALGSFKETAPSHWYMDAPGSKLKREAVTAHINAVDRNKVHQDTHKGQSFDLPALCRVH